MSDHNVIMAEIQGKDGEWSPRRTANKEMFFSNLLNEIKEEHIPAYLRYIWQLLSLIMNQDEVLNKETHEEILQELKTEIPIVETNRPRQIYDVERRVDELMAQGAPYGLINKEIAKLMKYSFQAYIKKNLQALQTNPKGYHRCIQNIIGWNLTLGPTTSIEGNVDMDPQQIYEDPGGEVFYGEEAKAQVQKEWEESYMSSEFTTDYKRRIKAQEVAESFTELEIMEAIGKTGKKGLAWDCITI